jgi:Ca-activated chloride channel family protein
MLLKNSWYLFLVPFVIAFYVVLYRYAKNRTLLFPTDLIIRKFKSSLKLRVAEYLFILRMLSVLCFVIALAWPMVYKEEKIRKEGIGIVFAIDCSGTMITEDVKLGFRDIETGPSGKIKKKISRIDAVKRIAKRFIDNRADDLIGVVVFAANAYIVSPPTFDYDWIKESIDRLQVGIVKDGTAIGSAILSSINLLKRVDAKDKIVILLTDGINNFGRVSPVMAAKAARATGIKIYTLGLSVGGGGLVAEGDSTGRKVLKQTVVEIDEEQLKEIAKLTGGEYYRVTDLESMKKSHEAIDKLEKIYIEEDRFDKYSNNFQIFLIIGFALLLLEIMIRNTILMRMP